MQRARINLAHWYGVCINKRKANTTNWWSERGLIEIMKVAVGHASAIRLILMTQRNDLYEPIKIKSTYKNVRNGWSTIFSGPIFFCFVFVFQHLTACSLHFYIVYLLTVLVGYVISCFIVYSICIKHIWGIRLCVWRLIHKTPTESVIPYKNSSDQMSIRLDLWSDLYF